MSIGYQRAQQQVPRIEEMTQEEARAEWSANRESYSYDLDLDEGTYRCYVQNLLYKRSINEPIIGEQS